MAIAACLVAGVTLRAWQYVANGSLWIDEAALALNVLRRRPLELLGGLDFAQTAAPGFVLIEKAVTSIFGGSEYALRAFPFICGLIALPLFAAVGRRVVGGWPGVYSTGLFALGTPFIYFASQAKPYSCDIATALGLLWLVGDWRRWTRSPEGAWLMAGAGTIAVCLSQPAVFLLAGFSCTLVLCGRRLRDQSERNAVRRVAPVWLAVCAIAVWWALHTVSADDREYFRWFWSDGFMPIPRTPFDALWIVRKITWAFGAFESGLGRTHGGLGYRWSWIFALVAAAGVWSLWKRDRDSALLLIAPFLAATAAATLRLFPFTARQIAFLIPSLLLALASGLHLVSSRATGRLEMVSLAIVATLCGSPLYAAATALPPFHMQHLRPVLDRVYRPGLPPASVYVYYGAARAFDYYAPRYSAFDRTVVHTGTCALGNPRAYLRDLDALRGRRVWLVTTHLQRERVELTLMLDYLDRVGSRLEEVVVPGTSGQPIEEAAAYLYDLTLPKSVDPEMFPIRSGGVPADFAKWGCYGVTSAPPPSSGRR